MNGLNKFCSFGCIIIGLLGLVGFIFDITLFSKISVDYIPMAPSTAISFILIGIIFLIGSINKNINTKVIYLFLTALFLVLANGFMVGLDAYFDFKLQIARLFYLSDTYFNGLRSGYMSPSTGILFFILGASQFILLSKTYFFRDNYLLDKSIEIIGYACLIAAATYCISYMNGNPFLYERQVIPMAMNTSIGFIFASLLVVNYSKNSLINRIYNEDNIENIIMRYFSPFILGIYFIGWLVVTYINKIFNVDAAIFSALLITIFLALIVYLSKFIATLTKDTILKYKQINATLKSRLEENARLLELSIKSANIGLWHYDVEKDAITITDNLNMIIGENPEKKWTFNSFIESLYKDDRQKAIDTYNKIHAPGKNNWFTIHTRRYWSDGSLHWYEIFGKVTKRDINGLAKNIHGAILDITDRKIISAKFKNYFNLPSTLNLICKLEGSILHFNDYWKILLGYNDSKLHNKNIIDLIYPGDHGKFRANISKVINDNEPRDFEARIKCVKQKLLNISWIVSVSLDYGELYFSGIDNTQLIKTKSELSSALLKTIEAISLTLEKRDPYTSGHMNKVAIISTAIAYEMGLSDEVIEGIRVGASIHDIGKIYIPAEILNRPGKLSIPEFEIIKTHPQVGYEIIKNIDFPWPVHEMVLQHHEKLDGSGYPNGLKEDQIIIEAQIIAVADVLEAVTSHRPYRPALPLKKGIDILLSGRGILYNADAVDACISLIESKRLTI